MTAIVDCRREAHGFPRQYADILHSGRFTPEENSIHKKRIAVSYHLTRGVDVDGFAPIRSWQEANFACARGRSPQERSSSSLNPGNGPRLVDACRPTGAAE